jgi:demethylmenaquinone methyltransferase/2-methoxy-6-polyprenyl-1,4-benzoquinol methylase
MTVEAEEQIASLKTESWRMFDSISRRYDFLNRVLSFGLDQSWRREIVQYLPLKPDQVVLDVATGTADVLIELLENNAPIHTAYGVDMSEQMLEIGRTKIEQRGLFSRAMLQRGDALDLNFLDQTFDAVTIAFGIRNLPSTIKSLMEMHRVLKPQGRLIILEFSFPKNMALRWAHHFYLSWVVPVLGFLLSGNYAAYRYLNKSIETFPYGDRFCKIITQVGFKNVQAHPLMGGIATIYHGDK